MSKATIALLMAGSVAAGASITALAMSSSSPSSSSSKQTTTTPSSSTSPLPPTPIRQPPPQAQAQPAYSFPPPPIPQPISNPQNLPIPPVFPAGILQYSSPGPYSDPLHSSSYHGSYSRLHRNPAWVAEHFTRTSLSTSDGNRARSTFHEDTSLPPAFRAKLSDYARSGYDRGHQVPAADAKWSQEAMDSTFSLSNMCPQVGEGFNRDYWAHFEQFCRDLTKTYPSVRVVTGPLYLPRKDERDGKWYTRYEVIGDPPNVSVPTHFFKVVFGEDRADGRTDLRKGESVAVGAFVLPNSRIANETRLSEFEVPVEAVERASGLVFAGNVPVAQRRRLCGETRCEIVVREFENKRREIAGGRAKI